VHKKYDGADQQNILIYILVDTYRTQMVRIEMSRAHPDDILHAQVGSPPRNRPP